MMIKHAVICQQVQQPRKAGPDPEPPQTTVAAGLSATQPPFMPGAEEADLLAAAASDLGQRTALVLARHGRGSNPCIAYGRCAARLAMAESQTRTLLVGEQAHKSAINSLSGRKRASEASELDICEGEQLIFQRHIYITITLARVAIVPCTVCDIMPGFNGVASLM